MRVYLLSGGYELFPIPSELIWSRECAVRFFPRNPKIPGVEIAAGTLLRGLSIALLVKNFRCFLALAACGGSLFASLLRHSLRSMLDQWQLAELGDIAILD
jgi:hypothetical protein